MPVSGDLNCRKKTAKTNKKAHTIGATVVAPHASHFWSAQRDIFEAADTLSRRWFARRQAAAQNAMEAAGTIGRAPLNPDGLLAVMGGWQADSLALMTEDLNDWFGFCRHCANVIASNEVEAEEEILEAVSSSADLQDSIESVPV